MTHTQGEWFIAPQEESPYEDLRVMCGKRGICLIWLDDAPVHDWNDEQRANARLIAAAPKLLEALTSLFDARVFRNDLTNNHMAVLDKARAIVAAAKGE